MQVGRTSWSATRPSRPALAKPLTIVLSAPRVPDFETLMKKTAPEQRREVIDRLNKGSPSTETFRACVMLELKRLEQKVEKSPEPVEIFARIFNPEFSPSLAISNITLKVCRAFGKEVDRLNREQKDAADASRQKHDREEAERQKEAFKKLKQEELRTHVENLQEWNILQPIRQAVLHACG